MAKLIVASNRVAMPRETRAGGLAAALLGALSEEGGIWFGWSGKVAETPGQVHKQTEDGITYVTVDLARRDYEAYYNGFANRTLWPLLHYRLDLVDYRRDTYRAYQRVNRIFARALAPLVDDDDLVWVHDYHLIPLAALLREEGVNARIGFYLHTPLPPPDLVNALPGHRALMDALTDYDVIGFQTRGDLQSFTDYMRDVAGAQVSFDDVVTTEEGQQVHAVTLPVSIDPKLVAEQAARASSQHTVRRLRDSLLGRWLVIGVDRLDYSKGLTDRFVSMSRFLERYPQHRRHVTMLQVAPATRGEVPEYKQIRDELEQHAGALNGRFAEADWVPLRYVNRTYPQSTLAGFYRMAQVGLVTPLRDGMNLVAKEYVAAQDPQDPGVLVLSSFAGAAQELEDALLVNPHDHEGVAEAMNRAMTMRPAERRRRWSSMRTIIEEWTINDWRKSFLALLADSRTTKPRPPGSRRP
ncbi:MAG: alpha,alpha-trehalose-phosphate synthase (UDP-forming) [Actinomycetota bacterium]|nr:alpha,alpha-trehalose-phosphate synthase (UDP-forming) [Actinomycetota bacterium]